MRCSIKMIGGRGNPRQIGRFVPTEYPLYRENIPGVGGGLKGAKKITPFHIGSDINYQTVLNDPQKSEIAGVEKLSVDDMKSEDKPPLVNQTEKTSSSPPNTPEGGDKELVVKNFSPSRLSKEEVAFLKEKGQTKTKRRKSAASSGDRASLSKKIKVSNGGSDKLF